LGRAELQPSQIEFLRATIQTLRNDLDLMVNATPDELFFYETIVSDPREYRRLFAHISQGQLAMEQSLETAIYETGVINPHLPKRGQSNEELFFNLSADLKAIFAIALLVYSYRGDIIKRYLAYGYDVTSPLSNEIISKVKAQM
jgi:hypothetical protein